MSDDDLRELAESYVGRGGVLPTTARLAEGTLELLDRVEVAEQTVGSAVRLLVRQGHTKHCAKRLLWGDGLCECGLGSP